MSQARLSVFMAAINTVSGGFGLEPKVVMASFYVLDRGTAKVKL